MSSFPPPHLLPPPSLPPPQVLVDLTSKSHQALCLPMLVLTSAWMSRLTSQPTCAPLLALLATCHEHLRHNFTTFVHHQLAAIDAYDSRRGMSASGVYGGGGHWCV